MGSPDSEKDRQADEGPAHRVELDGFWMGKCEVTVGQFRKFVDATNHRTDAEKKGESFGVTSSGGWETQSGLTWRNAGFSQTDLHPVVHVSWNDATAFCRWVSEKTGKRYGLPTEAQWEYACRGGTQTTWAWGDSADGGSGWLNAADQSAKRKYPSWSWPTFDFDDGYVYTAPVGTFRGNPFGLHDMHGNVWEWCADWYDSKYYDASPSRNPGGPSSGSNRVYRGGSWGDAPQDARSANRDWPAPGISGDILGFRVLAVSAAGR